LLIILYFVKKFLKTFNNNVFKILTIFVTSQAYPSFHYFFVGMGDPTLDPMAAGKSRPDGRRDKKKQCDQIFITLNAFKMTFRSILFK